MKTCLLSCLFLTETMKIEKFEKLVANLHEKTIFDMNTDLRKKAKTDFEKDFLKLMNNAVFDDIQMIFIKTLHKIFKIELILEIMN